MHNLIAGSSIILNLKNGSIVETKALEINEWGIRLEDGKSVSYKVISKIETNDKTIVSEIKIFIPQAETLLIDNTYIIDLSTVEYQKRKINENTILNNRDFTVEIFINSQEIINVESSIEPSKFLNFSFLFGISYGWQFNTFQENEVTYRDHFRTLTWNLGLGRIFRFENNAITIFFVSGNKIIIYERVMDEGNSLIQRYSDSQIIYYVTSSYQYHVFDSNFYIASGFQYYVKNYIFDKENLSSKEINNFLFKLGIGYSF